MKEALLYDQLTDRRVRCQTCAHRCVIAPGQSGLCGVRENQRGKLYLLVYGKAIAKHIDPIEKKPLYHFLPQSLTFSIATVGCNLACWSCQNWQISQAPQLLNKEKWLAQKENSQPADLVKEALKYNCPSISYTYTEPTVFLEYALETMKLAKKNRLKNIWVTNGFMTEQALKLILPYLDAANVDLKSFDDEYYRKYCRGRLEPILKNLKQIKKAQVHLEVTTLLIPGLTDQPAALKKIAQFIKTELGPETPWHISRFFPDVAWHFQDLPITPLATLEKAYQIGKKTGLKYIYQGNI